MTELHKKTINMYILQLQVVQMVRNYPSQCEELFLAGERRALSAAVVYDIFRPCFSPEGSNAREKELETMLFWTSFLEQCEGLSY